MGVKIFTQKIYTGPFYNSIFITFWFWFLIWFWFVLRIIWFVLGRLGIGERTIIIIFMNSSGTLAQLPRSFCTSIRAISGASGIVLSRLKHHPSCSSRTNFTIFLQYRTITLEMYLSSIFFFHFFLSKLSISPIRTTTLSRPLYIKINSRYVKVILNRWKTLKTFFFRFVFCEWKFLTCHMFYFTIFFRYSQHFDALIRCL